MEQVNKKQEYLLFQKYLKNRKGVLIMGQHWCTQGDGVFLNELKWNEDKITNVDLQEVYDAYGCNNLETFKKLVLEMVCQHDDDEGYAVMIPYYSRVDVKHKVEYFTSEEMGEVIHDMFKDYLEPEETAKTIASKIDFVEVWGYC